MIEDFSIVIPAKNEQRNIASLLQDISSRYPNTKVIIVDDGSTDNTADIAKSYGCHVISHPYSMGNGAAIKSGARNCDSKYIVFMDADGQHPPEMIPELMNEIEKGYFMVIGARDSKSQASIFRRIANAIYNKIASYLSNYPIKDLTSGFRVVHRDTFNRFLYLLPNGFSYPTTITMAFLRSGYAINYVPIIARERKGKSHINPLKDGLRFLLIIIKVASLYSPFKFFTPASILLFIAGIANYAYTYMSAGTFTNMSALLFIVSLIFFMFGLLAEQITTLPIRK